MKVRRTWRHLVKLIPYRRPSSIFLRRLPLHTMSPFLTMMRTMWRIFNLLRKLVVQKLARQRPIQERQLQVIYKWLGSLPGLSPTQLCRYEMSLTPYIILTISVACSCTLRCTNLVHWTQRHELPRDVWHHHRLFPGCSKSSEEEAAPTAACVVESVRCDFLDQVQTLTVTLPSQVFPDVKIGKSMNVRSNTLKFLNGA